MDYSNTSMIRPAALPEVEILNGQAITAEEGWTKAKYRAPRALNSERVGR